jgi:hypothetical protein
MSNIAPVDQRSLCTALQTVCPVGASSRGSRELSGHALVEPVSPQREASVRGLTYYVTLRRTDLQLEVSAETLPDIAHTDDPTSSCNYRSSALQSDRQTEAPWYGDLCAAPAPARFEKLALSVRSLSRFHVETISFYV